MTVLWFIFDWRCAFCRTPLKGRSHISPVLFRITIHMLSGAGALCSNVALQISLWLSGRQTSLLSAVCFGLWASSWLLTASPKLPTQALLSDAEKSTFASQTNHLLENCGWHPEHFSLAVICPFESDLFWSTDRYSRLLDYSTWPLPYFLGWMLLNISFTSFLFPTFAWL